MAAFDNINNTTAPKLTMEEGVEGALTAGIGREGYSLGRNTNEGRNAGVGSMYGFGSGNGAAGPSAGEIAQKALEAQKPLLDSKLEDAELDKEFKRLQIAELVKKQNRRFQHRTSGGITGARYSGTLAPGQNTSGGAMNAPVSAVADPTGPSLTERTTVGTGPGSLADRLKSSSAGRIATEQRQRPTIQTAVAAAAKAAQPAVAPISPASPDGIGLKRAEAVPGGVRRSIDGPYGQSVGVIPSQLAYSRSRIGQPPAVRQVAVPEKRNPLLANQ